LKFKGSVWDIDGEWTTVGVGATRLASMSSLHVDTDCVSPML